MTKLKVLIDETKFDVTVDYNYSPQEMLDLLHQSGCDYTCEVKEKYRYWNIQTGGEVFRPEGEISTILQYAHFEADRHDSVDVKEAVRKAGFRFATLAEMIAFGIKFPEEQSRHLIRAFDFCAYVYLANFYGNRVIDEGPKEVNCFRMKGFRYLVKKVAENARWDWE